jgi:hypothetical protein
LAEAHQELQMLQKRLQESEHSCCLWVLASGSPHCVALHGFGLLMELERKQGHMLQMED